MRRNVVDLPQPEGPSSTLSVPSSSAKDSPSTARTCPAAVVQCLAMFSTAIAATAPPVAPPCIPATPAGNDNKRTGSLTCSLGRARSAKTGLRKQGGEGRARVGRTHESLADQKGVHAVRPQSRHVRGRGNAAFGNDDSVRRDARQEIQRGLQSHF